MKEVTTTPPPSPVVLSFHTSRGSVEPFHQLLNVVNSKALPPWGNRGGEGLPKSNVKKMVWLMSCC